MPFVGGRGKKAPYITTHSRVPVPVKHIVDEVCDRYRRRLEAGLIQPLVNDLEELYLVSEESDTKSPDFNEAVQIAKEILKQKKSARVSMKKLLTSLYNTTATL